MSKAYIIIYQYKISKLADLLWFSSMIVKHNNDTNLKFLKDLEVLLLTQFSLFLKYNNFFKEGLWNLWVTVEPQNGWQLIVPVVLLKYSTTVVRKWYTVWYLNILYTYSNGFPWLQYYKGDLKKQLDKLGVYSNERTFLYHDK